MATETLRPSGVGNETNYDIHAPDTGEANWEDVDEVAADDLTTCLSVTGTSYARDTYALPNTTIPSGSTINSVTVHYRVRSTYLGTTPRLYARSAIRTHDTTYDGDVEQSSESATWFNYSMEYTLNPNTSLAWTIDELNAMEIGASTHCSDVDRNTFFTQVYVVIDYTLVTFIPTVTIL